MAFAEKSHGCIHRLRLGRMFGMATHACMWLFRFPSLFRKHEWQDLACMMSLPSMLKKRRKRTNCAFFRLFCFFRMLSGLHGAVPGVEDLSG